MVLQLGMGGLRKGNGRSQWCVDDAKGDVRQEQVDATRFSRRYEDLDN